MRATTSIKIEPALLEHSKHNKEIKSLSDWVNKRYEEEFINTTLIKEQILSKEQELEQLRIDLAKAQEVEAANKPDEKILSWLRKEGIKRFEKLVDKKPLVAWVNNEFSKNLTVRDLKEYIKIANGKKENV